MKKTKRNAIARKNAKPKNIQECKEKKEDFIMLPTVDFCFKELMQNKNIRRNIIAALLNIPSSEVEETKLMPTILQKESEEDKYGILDVRVRLKDGTQIDFEMQVTPYTYWTNRSIYYLGKMYTGQIKEGELYDRLKKCIHVSILDYEYFKDDRECYRRIAFCDTKTGKEYSDLLEMHILELAKLPPEQKNETNLLQWMRFLGGKNREEFEKMAKENEDLKEAYNELERLSADERKRLEYETRQKAIRDYKLGMSRAKEDGVKTGVEVGKELINQLNLKLMELDRTEDIIKAAIDSEYQKKLLEEFGLQ